MEISSPIVSVHTPKVAGTSFQRQLIIALGESNVLLDYQDDPVDVRSHYSIDPNCYSRSGVNSIAPYRAVHGHFHPSKYDGVAGAVRITFLRHPVDNLISIYMFWTGHDRSAWDSPVFQYVKDTGLTIEQFAMLPKLRFLYSEVYFGGVDMHRFDFVGDYERYDCELARLGAVVGIQFNEDIRLNVTKDVARSAPASSVGKDTRLSLQRILEQDIRFYERYAGK
ncbi:Sulfotransferase family protein [Aromatoleum tolulyticum]|uniref:Sulfotransferase family protein n=1 Tax=Aromatoleum tolulyticum TaxID=34027 RepID=A0A1N6UTF8_9RHOO|nr:sulfotransferase family 2 domain-containing protein [Aromatoleum tolulyticum]SIQ68869.1 Sulfotransferase family protein [Aromatoleum tolulyticum]